MGSEPADATQTHPAPSPATEERRFVGLTKEVLSAHTQKEEQEYVDRFHHCILQSPYSSYLQLDNSSMAHSHHPGMYGILKIGSVTAKMIVKTVSYLLSSLIYINLTIGDYPRPLSTGGWKRSRRGKLRHKRPKPQGSSDSYAAPAKAKSSWPSSESSQPQMGVPYSQPSQLQAPYYPMMVTQPGLEQPPRPQQLSGATPVMLQPPEQTQFSCNMGISLSPGMQPIQMEPNQNVQNMQNFPNLHPMALAQSMNPYVAPVMAVILPSYPTFTPGYPSIYPPSAPAMLPQVPINMTSFVPGSTPFQQPLFHTQPGPQTQNPLGPLLCSPHPSSSVGEEEEAAGPRALFSSSRSSSPLQLNLLQEELPKPNGGQGSTRHNHAERLHEQRANEVRVQFRVNLTGHMHLYSSHTWFSSKCLSFALFRVIIPVILGTMMPSLHPVSCLTCCCRRMPGQGPAPMHLDLAQESQAAPWDLDLVPMEPPHHILVREKSHMWLLMHSVSRDDK